MWRLTRPHTQGKNTHQSLPTRDHPFAHAMPFSVLFVSSSDPRRRRARLSNAWMACLGMILTACATAPPGACVGYPQMVCQRCGPNPAESEILLRVRQSDIPQPAWKDAGTCLNFYMDAHAKDAELARLSLIGCLNKTATIDRHARDKLLRVVDETLSEPKIHARVIAWESCYQHTLRSP